MNWAELSFVFAFVGLVGTVIRVDCDTYDDTDKVLDFIVWLCRVAWAFCFSIAVYELIKDYA